ncbi:hypothetical protein T11_14192 [Trichinella zimbabwensis]|uniref:Uncharacterized protein n=1 Tax=Trichinella zimbabwensis TaxID=268475 RepID=A0A0V1I686_9BILA|nr:hypothetical protein T11_14192 [Trichinella zimbabwensis]
MRPIDWKGICGQAALNRTRPWQFDDRLCHHHWTYISGENIMGLAEIAISVNRNLWPANCK